MPRDSNGNYSLPSGYLAVTGQTVLASQHNPPFEDLAQSMTNSLPRNGSAGMLADINLGGYKGVNAAAGTSPGDLVTYAQLQALLSATVPTGRLVVATGNQVEPGYLRANGQSVLRAAYPALWAYALASENLAASQGAKTPGQYGPGDGTTTFTVPDMAFDGGQFPRPLATGRTIGSSQADELKAHPHTATFAGDPVPPHGHEVGANYVGSGNVSNGGYLLPSGTGATTTANGGHTPTGTVTVAPAGGTETRPKNIAYPYLIKT